MEKLSEILSNLMSQNEINSAQLARKTGIGQPVIYRLMTGMTENPQIFTLIPIANFFKISLDQLFGLTPLSNQNSLNNTHLQDINFKLNTVKTISSVLIDLLPTLIEGYQQALSANLLTETIPADILPLLQFNAENLIKSANQIQEFLIIKTINSRI